MTRGGFTGSWCRRTPAKSGQHGQAGKWVDAVKFIGERDEVLATAHGSRVGPDCEPGQRDLYPAGPGRLTRHEI